METKKKYKQIKINLNEEDYYKVKKLVNLENETIANYFRKLVDAKYDNKRNKLNKNIDYKKLIFNIHRIGVNINQMTKKINTTGKIENIFFNNLETIKNDINFFKKDLEELK